MKLLLISLWYNPEPVLKPHDLAKVLRDRGHKVSVITGFPNYPSGKIYPGYKRRFLERELLDGIKVIRIPHIIDRSLSVKRRLLSYFSFSLMASIVGLFCKEKPDVIWTYQIGLPGFILSYCRGIPLVHEVQDLWPDWGKALPGGIKSWLSKILIAEENIIFKRAKKIITISKGFARRLEARGVRANKIVVIPNWTDENNFYPADRDLRLAEKEEIGGKFCFMYVGNVGTAQNLENLIIAARSLQDKNDIEIIIIGDGVGRNRLERLKSNYNLNNVRFLGYKQQSIISKYMALADVLLIHLGKDPDYEITIPSKTLGYLAVGKPILAVCAGDTKEIINDIGGGRTCEPGDPVKLASLLVEMSQLPNKELERMGIMNREAYKKLFSQDVLICKYEELFTKLLCEI